jgi:hypothetical protein
MHAIQWATQHRWHPRDLDRSGVRQSGRGLERRTCVDMDMDGLVLLFGILPRVRVSAQRGKEATGDLGPSGGKWS